MRILFTASDAGGCEALVPVIGYLKSHKVLNLMSSYGKGVMDRAGLPYIDADKKDFEERVDGFAPDVVVAGTSLGLSIDKEVIGYSRIKRIRSIAVVDYWSAYWQRFEYQGKRYLPDVICIIDQLMEREMVAEGFDPGILRITGNPRFESYVVDDSVRVDPERILFVSQPVSALRKEGLDYGYDESVVLKDLRSAVDSINKEHRTSFKLVIRPHPREIGKYPITDEIPDIDVSISRSRLIVGMSSVVLFQAGVMGKEVISYQPGVKKDISVLDKLGYRKTITEKSILIDNLVSVLIRGKCFIRGGLDMYSAGGKSRNVAGLILDG